MTVTIDASVLTAYYQARSGLLGAAASTATSSGSGTPKTNPTPPWATGSTAPQLSALTKNFLAGGQLMDANAAKLDVPGASADYKRLFSLYQGLNALEGVAQQGAGANVSASQRAQLSTRFAAGMQQLGSYLSSTSFDAFQIAQGTATAKAQATVTGKAETDVYTTATLHTGDAGTPVDAFAGPTVFSLTASKNASKIPTQVTVNFDLSEMGSTPRTMGNVVNYLNGKLTAAGLFSSFAVVRTPGQARTATAGGQTIALGTSPDSFALQFNGVVTETPAFSAPTTAPAVYVGQTVGDASATKPDASTQILKFQTDPSGDATDAATGKVFTDTLGAEVQSARASATGPDGSLYVLTDVDGTTDGQTIKGATDVALKKYDSAGNLVYSRTLGAAGDATGYALAVSADGSRVAIAGSVTGALDSGDAGADPTSADSFVTVLDSEGQDVFTQRNGATAADHVDSVAFAADGSVYVTGTTASAIGGQAAVGGQDAYVQGFTPAASGGAQAYTQKFTVQYGGANTDKAAGVAVSGSSLFVAGVEGGHAVVRRYDLQPTGPPALGAVRDLGALDGGTVAGVSIADDGSVIVAGATDNGALDVGTVANAYDGSGRAAFVAKLSADLTAGPSETLSYLNGTGDLTASAMTVSGGQVYLTGQESVAPPAGQTSAFDGYAAAMDPTTGQVTWSQSFRGADRMAAPTTIAVDQAGASVLDRLGLPRGTIDFKGTQQVTAITSARVGDQFYVQTGGAAATPVTVEAGDTLQTLANKIGRASGYNAIASVVTVKGVETLQVIPASTRSPAIRLSSGKAGRDGLEALGLAEGLVSSAPDKNTKDSIDATYSLKLPTTLSLDNPADAKQAQALLQSALQTVRLIYTDMTTPAATKTSGSGAVPAYLTAQIANYQQALQRLTGGS